MILALPYYPNTSRVTICRAGQWFAPQRPTLLKRIQYWFEARSKYPPKRWSDPFILHNGPWNFSGCGYGGDVITSRELRRLAAINKPFAQKRHFKKRKRTYAQRFKSAFAAHSGGW